ncbi:MAG: DUF6249 domain-containing protein [Gammaproteobacteria bacterium]|jgi:hypothetical protein
MLEELIPIVAILTVFGVLAYIFYLRYRHRQDIQQTLRAALDKGHDLSPELIASLAANIGGPHADLRRGVIAIAVGVALAGFAALVGEEDAQGPLMGLAMFPALVGVAYIGLWWFIGRRKEEAR